MLMHRMAVATLVASSAGVALTGVGETVTPRVIPGHVMRVEVPDTGRSGSVTGDGSNWTSTAADRESVSITVYNQNFGLVREVRDIAFTCGTASLEYADVAQHVQPETVHIRSLDAREVRRQDGHRVAIRPGRAA